MGDFVDMAELDQSVREKTERPSAPARWRASARQGDEVGLLLAVDRRMERCLGFGGGACREIE